MSAWAYPPDLTYVECESMKGRILTVVQVKVYVIAVIVVCLTRSGAVIQFRAK